MQVRLTGIVGAKAVCMDPSDAAGPGDPELIQDLDEEGTHMHEVTIIRFRLNADRSRDVLDRLRDPVSSRM